MGIISRVCIILLLTSTAVVGKKLYFQNELIEEDEYHAIVSLRQSFNPNVHYGNFTQNNVSAQFFCSRLSPSDSCPSPYAKFYLYTPDGTKAFIDQTDANWFAKSRFDRTKATVLLIHGFGGGEDIGNMPLLRRAYLKTGEYNVINADWEELVKQWCLIPATSTSVKGMGKCTAAMLTFFERSTSVNYQQVTCVGYSLGAHVCGLAANYLSKKLNKIIALDPAGPIMQGKSKRDRYDNGDAAHTQVIHTNAGFYGMSGQQGKVDFCINGGKLQTACQQQTDYYYCSHVHALCYMAESLFASKRRTAVPCSSSCPYTKLKTRSGTNATVGLTVESSASGMYCMYVEKAPYCQDPNDSSYGEPVCCDTSISTNTATIQTIEF